MAKLLIPSEDFYAQHDWMYRMLTRGITASGILQMKRSPNGLAFYVPFLSQPRRGRIDRNGQVKVTDPEAGGGKYAGLVALSPITPATATGDLVEADFADYTNAVSVLVLNRREEGKSTHDLDSGSLPKTFDYRLIGNTTDGKPIVVIDGLQQEDCEEPDDEGGE